MKSKFNFNKEYKKIPKCKYCGYVLCTQFNKPECLEMQNKIKKIISNIV